MADIADNITMGADGLQQQPINIPGLVVVIIFYLVILFLGLWATYRNKAWRADPEDVMLAGRDLGPWIGVFTLTATWVGGGYINGTAEFVFTPGYGLAWTQAMWGFTASLFLGGLFFAKPMRAACYVTMLDPYKDRYGRVVAALMYIPSVMGELFWSGAILSALGATLAVILGIRHDWSIAISAGIAVLYTVCGGLYSVVLTDVIQIFCIFIGLWIGVGFALTHPAVSNIGDTAIGAEGWVGKLNNDPWVGHWLDFGLLLVFGGIPWQVYFQRVLSARTPKIAQMLSFAGAAGCLILSIPAIMIGAIAKSTAWNETDYVKYYAMPNGTMDKAHYPLILPLVLQYLTPLPVAVIGLGAVSAAVMSSADSSLLSCGSMFARNVYQPIRDAIMPSKKASAKEIIWVLRIAVVILGVIAAAIAIKVKSIYALFVLCGDFVYVVAFPQLLCVMFFKYANVYGAMAGYIVSFFFRLTAGEPLLSFKEAWRYPYFDEDTGTQLLPIRTLAMLLGLLTLVLVSLLFWYLVDRGIVTHPSVVKYVERGLESHKARKEGRRWQEEKERRKRKKEGLPVDNLAYTNEPQERNGVISATKF